jgi:hypothetical protein
MADGRATSNRVPTILLAWHDCGKVVAAMVSRPEWPEDAEHRTEFKARQAGRSITEVPVSMTPADDEWCRCFRD